MTERVRLSYGLRCPIGSAFALTHPVCARLPQVEKPAIGLRDRTGNKSYTYSTSANERAPTNLSEFFG